MSLSWIGETFAEIDTKKAALSLKKALKTVSKPFLFKNYPQKDGFSRIELENITYGIVSKDVSIPSLASQVRQMNNFPPTGTGGECLRKRILFPHHGFW